jgi:hypothetical protein
MTRRKTDISKTRKSRLPEKVKALLLSDPDEADFSDDPLVRKIEEAFEGWTLEERRRWAEEWREKHRQSK